ncbi:MAG: hypothetical protein SNJ75_16930 [Gemmataceae bacterium]
MGDFVQKKKGKDEPRAVQHTLFDPPPGKLVKKHRKGEREEEATG